MSGIGIVIVVVMAMLITLIAATASSATTAADRASANYRFDWEGITIEVRYNPDWSPTYGDVYGHGIAHIEIEAVDPARAPLPMTETGYRSHFCGPAEIEAEGGPVAFALAWLDYEAKSAAWKKEQEGRRQLTLF